VSCCISSNLGVEIVQFIILVCCLHIVVKFSSQVWALLSSSWKAFHQKMMYKTGNCLNSVMVLDVGDVSNLKTVKPNLANNLTNIDMIKQQSLSN